MTHIEPQISANTSDSQFKTFSFTPVENNNDINHLYKSMMKKLSFKGEDEIYSHLKSIKEDTQSVYGFVSKVFKMLEQMAEMRADPLLKVITSLTLSIISEEKQKCQEDEIDYHSDDDDDKCIELSMENNPPSEAEAQNQSIDLTLDEQDSFSYSINRKMKTRNIYEVEFSKQDKESYLSTMTCPLDVESTESEPSEDLPQVSFKQSETVSVSRTISSISNFEDLQTVEERTVESEDEETYKKGSDSPVKIKYNSNINFDSLTKCGVKDACEHRFLRIKHLRRNYIVHYINKLDTDFRLSLEFLKSVKTLSIDIEATNKQTVSYIQFACRSKCYVFNAYRLGNNEDFQDFLVELFHDRRILKVVFDKVEFMTQIQNLLGQSKRIKFQSLYAVKQRLFTSDPANCDLTSCCMRLFNKKPDTIFRTWVSSCKEIGLDEIHYVALNALATLSIYVKIKSSLLVGEDINLQTNLSIQNMKFKDKPFVVDNSCPEIVSDILELHQCKFNVMKKGSYKEILKDYETNSETILITNDKYFLTKNTFAHHITYYNPKQLTEYLRTLT